MGRGSDGLGLPAMAAAATAAAALATEETVLLCGEPLREDTAVVGTLLGLGTEAAMEPWAWSDDDSGAAAARALWMGMMLREPSLRW
jgi:hypothetical protein